MNLSIFSLEGRVALITGGNGGLGRAMALGFCDAGARVAVTGRNLKKNNTILQELNGESAAYSLDVRDENQVEDVMHRVVERFGRLDILVNNAGTNYVNTVLEMDRKDWDVVIGTNLTGPFLCSKHAARKMVERGEGGKIINIGSIVSAFGPPDFAGYAASKAGMIGLNNALAVELAPYNIQVNLIEPGYFEAEMSSEVPGWLREELERKTPAGRWGDPDELVGAAVFLASHASDYITGACLRVDGGYAVRDRFRQV